MRNKALAGMVTVLALVGVLLLVRPPTETHTDQSEDQTFKDGLQQSPKKPVAVTPSHAASRKGPPGSAGPGPAPIPPQSRNITEPYRYPVVPGTAEWKRRVWNELPWDLCRIPENTLTNLTDAALVSTCLRYPMRGDVCAAQSRARGIEVLAEQFNGLREMFSRSGAATELARSFQQMSAEQLRTTEVSNENWGIVELDYISALLLHPEIISKLTEGERESICRKALVLQSEMREADGPSAGETPAAQIAAAMLAGGTRLQTSAGMLDYISVFQRELPDASIYYVKPPGWDEVDKLAAAGDSLRETARKH